MLDRFIKRKEKGENREQPLELNNRELQTDKSEEFRFEYAPSLESRDLVKIAETQKLFIQGAFVNSEGGSTFPSINPASGEVLSQVVEASRADVDLAVAAARKAQKHWGSLSGYERAKYLYRIARLIQDRSRELAVLETLDNGKPIKESRDVDIPLVAAHFFYHAGWADKLEYAFAGQKTKPLGVVAQVIPWNFPLMMAAWKIAPALATGNCVVLKPAETTSLSVLLLAEILQQAGLPEGVVNIVTGGPEVGRYLVNHPDINKVAFTGSTEVGKRIASDLAHRPIPLTLELGGKSANIVYEDAAIDQAVEGVVNGIFFNQGHVCCAGSRLLLEESIHKIFTKKLKTRMQELRVGEPLDKNTDVGAIHSEVELKKIRSMVQEAKDDGLDYFSASQTELPEKGFFHKPCFFKNVPASASIYRMEVFGPVLAISTFRTPTEAIQKANDTPYGLAAGIWSEKASKIQKTAQALKAGVVWANTYNKFDPASPFGGYKESGYGREGGRQGLQAYVEVLT